MDKLTEILDKGGAIDIVYLDLAKAFDTVPHQRLLIKLRSYGIAGKLLEWITNFLTGRRQRVGVAAEFSAWREVLSGVLPQGSALGPIGPTVHLLHKLHARDRLVIPVYVCR